MAKLAVKHFNIQGPALITPQRHGDGRGWFMETWNTAGWAAAGLPETGWVQDNEAYSAATGTTRGLHFQAPPAGQAKLIRATSGAIFDVAVDIRKASPTFGQHIAVTLTAESGDQLFVPRGFAHGYQTLTADTRVAYKCDGVYDHSAEGGLLWNDASLAISWPAEAVTLSDKDRDWPTLAQLESPF